MKKPPWARSQPHTVERQVHIWSSSAEQLPLLRAVRLLYDLSGLGLRVGTGTKSYLLLGSDFSLPFCFPSFGSYAISHTSKIHWPDLNDFYGMSKIPR